MPTVIIVSDSHGLMDELELIKERHKDEADAFIHCGDSELSYDCKAMNNFEKVQGNCDFDSLYAEELSLQIEELPFFVTHGHLFRVKTTLMPLSYRAEELGAKVVCFGHSHIAGAEIVGERLFINPGSIRLPRRLNDKTYVKLSWQDKEALNVEFWTLSGTKIIEMSNTFTFQVG